MPVTQTKISGPGGTPVQIQAATPGATSITMFNETQSRVLFAPGATPDWSGAISRGSGEDFTVIGTNATLEWWARTQSAKTLKLSVNMTT